MEKLEIGDVVSCLFPVENEHKECSIIDIREGENGKEYFVHFDGYNKRNDRWAPFEDFDMSSLVKSANFKPDETSQFLGLRRNVEKLVFGDYMMEAWYFSPFPEPYHNLDTIYCCEFCMRFFSTENEYFNHCACCDVTHPPGDEIYRKGRISAYEVDGLLSQRWCTNLCLITKLFLDHKTEYYNPSLFYFYIVCFVDEHGAHPCGFFSKEKIEDCKNNLACILAFPCYQKSGVGRFLISLSYELSKIEGRYGGPEEPLSDLGMLAYKSYRNSVITRVIVENQGRSLSFKDLQRLTGMKDDDIKIALLEGRFLMLNENKEIIIGATRSMIQKWEEKESSRPFKFDPKRIRWTPPPKESKNKDRRKYG